MSSEEADSQSDSERSTKKSGWKWNSLKPVTISGRQCLIVNTKLTKVVYASLMLHAEKSPESVNKNPPSKPGYHKCEVFVVRKRIKREQLIQDDLSWIEKGHRTSYYILKGGNFMRTSDYKFSSWPGLEKTAVRMLLIDEKHEHCFNSLIVFKCKSNFQRPVFNLRDVEVNHVGERSFDSEAENGRLSAGSTEDLREEEADEQKCVEMGIDANGKPIKRQAPANNKKPGNNQKKGGSNNNNIHHNRTVGPPQQNRRKRCLQNNGNRNEASPSGYNGPSANNVGQSAIGANMNPSFGGPAPSAMEVPEKNSNHKLFGKMIGRQMEQIQDAAVVDQLQNRMMNLMHDALAEQEATTRSNEKQQQQQGGFNQQQQQQQRSLIFQQQQRSAIAVKRSTARMYDLKILKDGDEEHCLSSLIIYKCQSEFKRPVFNLRDAEVNHVGERSFDSEAENGRLSAGSTEDLQREEEADGIKQ
ncbi:hypothetical protein B9Z55_019010 [Caenorhabditis nigoni]|uniref:Uncharacterized protein n=1 Tax=Caenorhabditis nigoni TaxID=1611254 RepID=A0A2G5TGJ6_9PELO|nr:hypothetical protein B9Z55_019010 [Caenorhabditis nigoni]